MTKQDFIAQPIRLIQNMNLHQIRKLPLFIEFWNYPTDCKPIDDHCFVEVGCDEHYRYVITASRKSLHQGGK